MPNERKKKPPYKEIRGDYKLIFVDPRLREGLDATIKISQESDKITPTLVLGIGNEKKQELPGEQAQIFRGPKPRVRSKFKKKQLRNEENKTVSLRIQFSEKDIHMGALCIEPWPELDFKLEKQT